MWTCSFYKYVPSGEGDQWPLCQRPCWRLSAFQWTPRGRATTSPWSLLTIALITVTFYQSNPSFYVSVWTHLQSMVRRLMGSAMADPHLMVITVDWSKVSGVINCSARFIYKYNRSLYKCNIKFLLKKLIKFITISWKFISNWILTH